jgi:hypothetical protein
MRVEEEGKHGTRGSRIPRLPFALRSRLDSRHLTAPTSTSTTSSGLLLLKRDISCERQEGRAGSNHGSDGGASGGKERPRTAGEEAEDEQSCTTIASSHVSDAHARQEDARTSVESV